MALIIVIIGLFTGLYPYHWNLGWAGMLISIIPLALTIFLGAMIYGCIGLCIAAKTDMTNTFLWNNLINMPLVFISGAIIPIGSFGVDQAKYALLFNPTTWMADAIRVFLGGEIGPDGTATLFCGGNFLLGYLLDIAVMGLFGILLLYLAFRIFGGSLTESSGGISGTIQKKSADARKKMFKDLEPEDRQIMMKVTNKINMLQMGQIMGFAGDGRQDLAVKMLKDAGISDEDINKFFAAGMHMMEKMRKQAKK
jgi:hypothetical protein